MVRTGACVLPEVRWMPGVRVSCVISIPWKKNKIKSRNGACEEFHFPQFHSTPEWPQISLVCGIFPFYPFSTLFHEVVVICNWNGCSGFQLGTGVIPPQPLALALPFCAASALLWLHGSTRGPAYSSERRPGHLLFFCLGLCFWVLVHGR